MTQGKYDPPVKYAEEPKPYDTLAHYRALISAYAQSKGLAPRGEPTLIVGCLIDCVCGASLTGPPHCEGECIICEFRGNHNETCRYPWRK